MSPLQAFKVEEVSGCPLLVLFPGGCGVSSLHASGFTLSPRKTAHSSWFANPDAVFLRSTGRCESSMPSQELGGLRVSGGPGTGRRGWTGRPRSVLGCGSGYCRWRETEDRDTNQTSVRKTPIYTTAESHSVSVGLVQLTFFSTTQNRDVNSDFFSLRQTTATINRYDR